MPIRVFICPDKHETERILRGDDDMIGFIKCPTCGSKAIRDDVAATPARTPGKWKP